MRSSLLLACALCVGCGKDAPPPTTAVPPVASSASAAPPVVTASAAPSASAAPVAAPIEKDTDPLPTGFVGEMPVPQVANLLRRYSVAQGHAVSSEVATSYLAKSDTKLPTPLPPFPHMATCAVCDQLRVYRVDANNDSSVDYVLVSRNSVAKHNDLILGVIMFDATGQVKVTDTPSGPPFDKSLVTIAGFWVDEKGATFLVEPATTGPMTKIPRWLWKDTKLTKAGDLDRAKIINR